MGKKKGGHKQQQQLEMEEEKATVFVLKVAMHCRCEGCIDKIRGAVKDLTTLPGVERWDHSKLESKGEVVLAATADPEKLRHRLHRATRKKVDLLFPTTKEKDANKKQAKANAGADAAAVEALLKNLTLQQQQQGHQQQVLLSGGGGWNGGMGYAAYPWASVQQQPDPYAAYYSSGGAAASWGAYPPPAQQQHQAYYGAPWHGGQFY